MVCADDTGRTTGTISGGSSTFIGATDTPAAYTSQANRFPAVNAGEVRYVCTQGGGFAVTSTSLAADSSVVAGLANANTWTGIQTHAANLIVSGASAAFDASGAITTKPDKIGTERPGTCAVGESFFDTDETAGLNSYGCTSADTWTLQGDGALGADSIGTSELDDGADTPASGEWFRWTPMTRRVHSPHRCRGAE